MWSRGWLILGVLTFPAPASAQAMKAADIVGGWRAVKIEYPDSMILPMHHKVEDLELMLWPDGLWMYQGPLMVQAHGGARWRLIGDTLWLGNDYEPYYHPIFDPRKALYLEKQR